MVDRSVLAHPVPDRERDSEEALTADRPVRGEPVDPVLVAHAHVRRVPADLAPAPDQLLLVLHRADEPLPARDDLERAVALLEELDGALDRLRLADQLARLLEQLGHALAGLVHGEAGDLA